MNNNNDAAQAMNHAADASSSVLVDFLNHHPSILFLRLQWQDLSGHLRGRVVPIELGKLIAMGKKVLRLRPCSLNLTVENTVLPAGCLLGSDTGCPDWRSLRTRQLLDPQYAMVMCRVVHGSTLGTNNGKVGENNCCPRTALQNVLDKALQQHDINFLVGFEVEFEVFKRSSGGELMLHSVGIGMESCSGFRDPCYKYVEETVAVLLEAGVGLETIHTEGRRGQFEISLQPKSPMDAVDELVFVHDTLKTVFANHGLVVTMFPRPVASRPQSIGQHTHLSISQHGKQTSFLAGILRNLANLSAFCLPYELSYERFRPGQAGCQFVAWGTEDRRVPVRKINSGHWEIRCIDATANMYLALAAILAAGLLGCTNSEPLLLEDSATHVQIVGDDLPGNLEVALFKLEKGIKDENFHRVERIVGGKIFRHYLDLKKLELLKLKEMGAEEARNWLVEIF